MLFRESIILNGILTNAESCYGLSSTHISQIESVDKVLLRNIQNNPMSTPVEALFLEMGILSIGTTIKARRVNYLHYLATRNEREIVFKVFIAQWNRPVKNDWTLTMNQDLRDLNIEENILLLKSKSSESLKKIVNKK